MSAKGKRSITKTPYYSACVGGLADGCKFCVRGAKIVIFITGLCSRKCYFCPTSDEKQYKDVVYANERKIDAGDQDAMLAAILEEAKTQNARGAGITGGDPLQKLERTCSVINFLKQEFDEKFHIHLYTPLDLVNTDRLRDLYEAGLDEIRFHPDLDDDAKWKRIELARQFPWKVGVEIPVIPDKQKETENLIMFLQGQIDFLNLNELEVADNSQSKLVEMGYMCKDDASYAVSGSEESAKKIMEFALEQGCDFDMHYCSAKLKDAVQLAQRILRTGKNVKRPFEKITSEGLLERGVIYLDELAPSFGHSKKILAMPQRKKENYLKELDELRKEIISSYKVKADQLVLDERKVRLITSPTITKRLAKKLKGAKCALTTEYPTYDQIEIELEYLN